MSESSFEAMGEVTAILRHHGYGIQRAEAHELKIGWFVFGETDEGIDFVGRPAIHDDHYQLPAIVQVGREIL